MTATIHHLRRPYRILVTGSRDWRDEQKLRLVLVDEAILRLDSGVVIVHGACPTGADAMAAEWASNYGVPDEPHRAKWEAPCRPECEPGHRRRGRDGAEYCPAAGSYRNQAMVDAGADVCVAFFQPGAPNRGTSDCVRRAGAARIRVRREGAPEVAA